MVRNLSMEKRMFQINEQMNLVDIVSQFTRLKPVGEQFVGLCPFHQENTPSFFVHPEKEVYYCFGCNAHGNKKTFLRQIGFEFGKSEVSFAEKFANYAVKNLLKNKDAIAWLREKGFTNQDIKDYEIGFIDNIEKFIEVNQNSIDNLKEIGVVDKSGNFKFSNFFVFPVYNIKNRIEGFVFRTTEGYINSKFKAKSNVFGLKQAYEYIKAFRKVYVVEGIRDVVAMRQNGFFNTVASLGCNFTQNQLNLLARLADEVVLVFDGDESGRQATLSAVTKLELPTKISVVLLENGDPFDNKENLSSLIKELSVSEYLKTLNYKANAAVKVLNNYTDDIVLFEEIKNFSTVYGVPEQIVASKIEQRFKRIIPQLTNEERVAGYILNKGFTPSPFLFTSLDLQYIFSENIIEETAKLVCLYDKNDEVTKDSVKTKVFEKFVEACKQTSDPIEMLAALYVVLEALNLED